MGREDEIRLIAYKIWEEEGCLDGHDYEHWFRAEIIWEQQQKEKAVTNNYKANSNRSVTQSTKATGKSKKSKRT